MVPQFVTMVAVYVVAAVVSFGSLPYCCGDFCSGGGVVQPLAFGVLLVADDVGVVG